MALSSVARAGNTAAQEKFAKSLNTEGAFDDGSGFERKFGAGETNAQYEARLEAWKNRGKAGTGAGAGAAGGAASMPATAGLAAGGAALGGSVGATSGGLGTPVSPTSATAAVEGLQGAGGAAATTQPGVAMSGGGGPVELPGAGSMRQGLGQRIYPEMNSALAGLKRIY